jgi:hypothetical protein
MVQRMTLGQLEVLIRRKRQSEKAEPMRRKRDRLLKLAAKLQRKIDRIMGGRGAAAVKVGRPRKRKLSTSARRRIAQAQKARWAKYRAAKRAKKA